MCVSVREIVNEREGICVRERERGERERETVIVCLGVCVGDGEMEKKVYVCVSVLNVCA